MNLFIYGTLFLLIAACSLVLFYALQRILDSTRPERQLASYNADARLDRGIDTTRAYLHVLQTGKLEELVNAPLPSYFSEELLLKALLRIQDQPTFYDRFIERLTQKYAFKDLDRLALAWQQYSYNLSKGMTSQKEIMETLSERLSIYREMKNPKQEPEPEVEQEPTPIPENPLTESDSISIGSPLEISPEMYHRYPYQDVRASDKGRFEHVYLIGKTGSGKSNTLKNMIAQDLQNDQKGVIVISPEPELLESLIPHIQENRHEHLVYFDPSVRSGDVIGWNPFDFSDADRLPKDKREDLLAQRTGAISVILERTVSDLGVSMRTVVKRAVSALLQIPNATFKDFARLINPRDSSLRDTVTAARSIDPETRQFWAEYEQNTYFKNAYGSVLNRLSDFLSPPLSTVFSTHTLSWKDILSKPSIVFLDLSRITGDPQETAGQLLIAAIQTALYERIQLPESRRLPYYYIYIDEFAKFIGAEESFRDLFARIRKCNVSVTVAHQTRVDLQGKLESTIVSNVKTMIIMQVSAQDAPFFARELQLFDIDKKNMSNVTRNWLMSYMTNYVLGMRMNIASW
jgi:hypothetical protein